MRYELRRLETLGAFYPDHPNHNIRHIAIKDAAVACARVKTVLVLGCGRGFVEYLLTDGWQVTSVDISEDQIEVAREVNRRKRNRHFIVGDVFRLAEVLGDRTFDMVIVSEMIEHLQEDERVLNIAHDRLTANGYFLLTVPNLYRCHNALNRILRKPPFLMVPDHLREYEVDGIRTKLEKAHFKVLRWRGIWFEFPRSGFVERFIAPTSDLRRFLAFIFPWWATYLMFVCHKA